MKNSKSIYDRYIALFLTFALLITGFGSVPLVYGNTGSAILPGNQGTFTPDEISRGLDFCRQYPVTVNLQGQQVATKGSEVPPVIIGERTLIPARAFFETLGARVFWDDGSRKATIIEAETTIELTIDSTITLVNGKEKLLEVPAMIIDHDGDGFGSTMLPLRFVSEGLGYNVSWAEDTRTATVAKEDPVYEGPDTTQLDTPFGKLAVLNTNAREKLVIIDLGHGGRDTGAIALEDQPGQVYEKDINLQVGLKLKEYLDLAGFRYLFTREDDSSLTLLERPAFANENKGDIFVSIHNNSSEKSAPKGTEVYYYSKTYQDESQQEGADGTSPSGLSSVTDSGVESVTDAALALLPKLDERDRYGIYSKDIARAVQTEMVRMLGTDNRGAKEGPKLAVLNKTSMPAIIVEGAFLSNSEDYQRIIAADYADKYAFAVANGLVKAMNEAF